MWPALLYQLAVCWGTWSWCFTLAALVTSKLWQRVTGSKSAPCIDYRKGAPGRNSWDKAAGHLTLMASGPGKGDFSSCMLIQEHPFE